MKKKDLFEQNAMLSNRLESLGQELENYKKLYDENLSELQSLRQELAKITSALDAARAENESLTSLDTPKPEQKSDNLPEIPDVPLSGVWEYGSQIIGKIITKAASAGNDFSENRNVYSGDLINLVLGKTEVCKSEIYEIIAAAGDDDYKRGRIDDIYNEAVDYINSLYKQV